MLDWEDEYDIKQRQSETRKERRARRKRDAKEKLVLLHEDDLTILNDNESDFCRCICK